MKTFNNMRGQNLKPQNRETPEGPERQCVTCLEWWPADETCFFVANKRADGLFPECKACTGDRARAAGRRIQPAYLCHPPATEAEQALRRALNA